MEYHRNLMKLSLSESLRELMERNLFEKITIKQICDRTGVIRATFYNYFDDKYDCLNWIVYHDLAEEQISSSTPQEFMEGMRNGLKTIEENKMFYRAAYNVTGQNSFEDMVRANLKITLSEYFRHFRRPGYKERFSNELLSEYYAEALAFFIKTLVFDRGPEVTAENVMDVLTELMKTSFTDFCTDEAAGR